MLQYSNMLSFPFVSLVNLFTTKTPTTYHPDLIRNIVTSIRGVKVIDSLISALGYPESRVCYFKILMIWTTSGTGPGLGKATEMVRRLERFYKAKGI